MLSTRDGRGSLVDCDPAGGAGPAVAVEEGGLLHARQTGIHDGDGPGIVATGGAPVFEDCVVRDVGGHGVVIAGDADPTLARCRIEGTGGHAMLALGSGTGRLVDCRLSSDVAPRLLQVCGRARNPSMFAPNGPVPGDAQHLPSTDPRTPADTPSEDR